VFDPSLGSPPPAQIHDFNPGIAQSGLFWTTVVSGDSVHVDLDAGTASLEVHDLPQKDYHDFENAMLGNGAKPRMGMVSFRVEWTAEGEIQHYDLPDQHYRADMRFASAQMAWTGSVGDWVFESAAIGTSAADFAQLGHESNGSFY
jgi:hypothetical protein